MDLLESPQSSLAPLACVESSKGEAPKCHPGDANMQENHGDQEFTVGPEPSLGEARMQIFGISLLQIASLTDFQSLF